MPRDPMALRGRVAAVTGSCSGIGLAIARGLASQGASVVITSRTESVAVGCAQTLAAEGLEVRPLALNVCESTSVSRLRDLVRAEFGRLDVLVNNAGVFHRALVADMPEALWRQTLDVNLTGAFRVTQALLPLLSSPGGRIVNITSGLAEVGCHAGAAYAASKAGLVAFTRSLAHELAWSGINVNALSPGLLETRLALGAFTSEEVESVVRRSPNQRLGQPADIVGTVLFLVSDASTHLTGQVIFLKSPVPVLAPGPEQPITVGASQILGGCTRE